MTTLAARRRRSARFLAILLLSALSLAACGKVSSGDKSSPEQHGDAGPKASTVVGSGGGGLVGTGGGSGGAGGFVGGGAGAPTSVPEAGKPKACEDVTGTLPTACAEGLCDCMPTLVRDCGVKCWTDVACVWQRCAGKVDANCADSCGDPGVPTRDAIRRCVAGATACDRSSCGDGVVKPPETCDGRDVGGRTCRDLGYLGGELACSSCQLNMLGCMNCGNGGQDIGEDCDGSVPDGATCEALGYAGGQLGCDPKCHFDTSACTSCGNGRLDEGEDCDGDLLLGGVTCRKYGFSGGKPGCKSCSVDTRSCPACGNGVIDAGETCDGSALGGATCTTLGLPSGTLACDQKSCRLDIGGCAGATPKCGDGVAEPGEECDGKDLAGLDCTAFGFDGGALGCNAQTCRFVDTGCIREPHDECKECRELKCKYQLEQCTADPRCSEGLHCVKTCTGPGLSPGQFEACANLCFADDFGNLPPNVVQALSLVMTLFGCTSSKCTASCVGPLP